MKRIVRIIALLAAISALLVSAAADTITTTLTLRVSRLTQNAVIHVGEDLTMEVGIEGAEPDSYQWFFNNVPIENANQRAYTIGNAVVEDSGIYRMDAYNVDGTLIVSMDVSARVLDNSVPQTGDRTAPYGAIGGMMLAAAAATALTLRKKANA